MDYELTNLGDIISNYLDPEMDVVMNSITQTPKYSDDDEESQFMMLPTQNVDLSPKDVSRLIALSANKYANAVRLASLARAKFKLCEAAYKHKLKVNSNNGKNEAERGANAAAASEEEYKDMVLASVVVEVCESIESANRIASESSRRMLLAADQHYKADSRFNNNQDALNNKDFSSW